MKKFTAILFLITSIAAISEPVIPSIDKKVEGVNKEKLDIRELKSNNIILSEENTEIKDTKDIDDSLQNNTHKIKVIQSNDSLENEISQKVETKSSAWKFILGGIAIIGLVVAL